METTERELCSLHTLARTEEGETLWLTYRLLSDPDGYGISCCLEGMDLDRHPHAAAVVRGLCADRRHAEETLRFLAARQVFPAHLADLLLER